MMNNSPMIRLLIHYGAEESPKIQPEQNRYENLCQQIDEIRQKSSPNHLIPDESKVNRFFFSSSFDQPVF